MNLKRDWPIVAAGALLLIGLLVWSRSTTRTTQQPIKVGGADPAYLQAQVALEQGRLQAQTQLFGSYIAGMTKHEEIAASREVALAQAEAARATAEAQTKAQLAAIQAQQQQQSQANLFGLIGAALPFIFGLFCRDVTENAQRMRAVSGARFRVAYGLGGPVTPTRPPDVTAPGWPLVNWRDWFGGVRRPPDARRQAPYIAPSHLPYVSIERRWSYA